MNKKTRIPKSLIQNLNDLDAHLFSLRESLHKLGESPSHLKDLSGKLRLLVCTTGRSRNEGLLFRLVNELDVDDNIFLHVPGKLDKNHPLAKGLRFLIIPIQRGGKGDPRLPPNNYSFKKIINDTEALVVDGEPLTHEELIRAIAEQMGSAHEDEGLVPALVQLKSMFINGVEPYIPVLATDGELALEIGERVLRTAEKKVEFKRQIHKRNQGDVSIVVRLQINKQITNEVLLFHIRSYINNSSIVVNALSDGISFSLYNQDTEVTTLISKYPNNWIPGDDTVFVFSYSSQSRKARTITNNLASEVANSCDIGWINSGDLILETVNIEQVDFITNNFFLIYEKLLSPQDCKELHELPPSGHGLWKTSEEIEKRGVFPD